MSLNLKITDSTIGVVMKEALRRAMVFARKKRTNFTISKKTAYDGFSEDIFTDIDQEAQKIMVGVLEECLPGIGIIAEEGNINTKKGEVYFTIDPIDGTKAYVRRQSHGVSSMIALVCEGEVISAYIGDFLSGEIYGFRPGSEKVHRILDYSLSEQLIFIDDKLETQPLLLRKSLGESSNSVQSIRSSFGRLLVEGGSIGTWAAKLWKREVGAVIMAPSYNTPWDFNPILGISKKLGYSFYKSVDDWWEEYHPEPVSDISFRKHDLLIIHKKDFRKLKRKSVSV